jgi:1-phosphatidylinositol-4-phosphate 5-kinase
MAVKSVNAVEELSVEPRDFQLKYYFELLPRRVGNDKSTMKICKFFDYAPQVFNSIRKIYGIENDDYLRSIGPESMLSSILKGDLSTVN